jgi:hypothetical protein
LAKNLPTNIKILYLDTNNISGNGAKALAENLPDGLTHLQIHNNSIGIAGKVALENAMVTNPNLDIKYD